MNEEDIVTSEASQEDSDTSSELAEVTERLEHVEEVVSHPLLSTPLEDYTVTEGLLFGLLIAVLVICLARIVKGAFSWL